MIEVTSKYTPVDESSTDQLDLLTANILAEPPAYRELVDERGGVNADTR
jgi:hypothetical protein